jgi:hypothetical protein
VKKAVGESPKGPPRLRPDEAYCRPASNHRRERRRRGSEAEEDRGREEVTGPVTVDFCAELPRAILPIMTYETSPFAFRVEADPQRQDRYLWAIGYGPQTYRRSPHSFATRREAKNDALKAMSKMEAHWRRERDGSLATGRA